MNDFHYIAVLLDLLYGITLDEDDLEEIGLQGWELIGNKNIRFYRYSLCISDTDKSIELPCNVLHVESVTTTYEDPSPYGLEGSDKNYIENAIEAEKTFQSPNYNSGKLIKYTQSGNKLYFAQNYGKVNILYKGTLLDDSGLPQISDKEARAIATYIAYILKFKEGLQTNNTLIINLSSALKLKWLQECDQARVTYLNENEMNEILDIKNSFNRTLYGRSFKFRL